MKISRVLEANAFLFRNRVSRKYGPELPLSRIPQEEWRSLASQGYDAVWLMGVWTRSPGSAKENLHDPLILDAFDAAVPGWQPENVIGSPYAIYDYQVDPRLDSVEGFRRLKTKMNAAGLKLILDFVPNHLALDHPWVRKHPERLMQGNEADWERDPDIFYRPEGQARIFAHGKDPFFPSWKDTVQVNYFSEEAAEAMLAEALRIQPLADGFRCDMAMLVTSRIFHQTWGGLIPRPPQPRREFWPWLIEAIRSQDPNFIFIAEVYWGLEWGLQQEGFDYTYDKILYDRLLQNNADSVREHLWADLRYQTRSLRFTENHDEERAAKAFGRLKSLAAAALAMTVPGAHLLHDGQSEGRRSQQPLALIQEPADPGDPGVEMFYARLLDYARHPALRQGTWRLLETRPAWEGNPSHMNLVAYVWMLWDCVRVVVVNYAAVSSQGRVLLPLGAVQGPRLQWYDCLTLTAYSRDGREVTDPGLYVELPAWHLHLFDVKPESSH